MEATEAESLRKAIAKYTGRMPVSTDVPYLTRRLATLKESHKEGESTRFEYAEPTGMVSVSMALSAKDAARRVAKKDGIGLSELVRRALREYMVKHDHDKEAKSLGAE